MIPDIDTWRAAQLLVKRYGADAGLQAGMRADELLAEGDVEGGAIWRAIIRAIAVKTRLEGTARGASRLGAFAPVRSRGTPELA